MPNDGKDYSNTEAILSTLVQNSSLVLIDCDFNTDFGYFANSQEIYLVQSMDILTIQELTGFLRDLKTKGILDQEKLRVVVNKELKVRNLSSKAVIGWMSKISRTSNICRRDRSRKKSKRKNTRTKKARTVRTRKEIKRENRKR